MDIFSSQSGPEDTQDPNDEDRKPYRPAKLSLPPMLKTAADHSLADHDVDKRPQRPELPTVDHLIDAWRRSEDFSSFAESTRTRYLKQLKLISQKFGPVLCGVFQGKVAKDEVVAWRNEIAGERPRVADEAISVLRRLVKFGMSHGYLVLDPTAGIKQAWKGIGTEHQYWTEDEISTFQVEATRLGVPEVGRAVRFIAGTGLRASVAINIRWSDLRELTIALPTRKGGKREAKERSTIRLPQLDPLLAEMWEERQEGDPDFILLKARRPWVRATLYWNFDKIRDRLRICNVDPDTGERTAKIFQDLRRTFAVRLILLTSHSDSTIASLSSWTPESVAILRALIGPVDRQ